MALITQHGSANRVIDTGLTVTYDRRWISGSWAWTNSLNEGGVYTSMQEYHRHARKSYRYVGMTDAAKDACIAAMITLYTRTTKTVFWQESGGGSWGSPEDCGTVLMAEISPSHNEDGSWDVVVNVDEDDVRWTKANDVRTAKSLFTFEQARSYDGETEAGQEPDPDPEDDD